MPFFLCALNLECFSSSHLSDHLDIHVAPVVLSLSVHAASVHGAFSVSTYAKAADMGASVVAQTTKPDIEFIRKYVAARSPPCMYEGPRRQVAAVGLMHGCTHPGMPIVAICTRGSKTII